MSNRRPDDLKVRPPLAVKRGDLQAVCPFKPPDATTPLCWKIKILHGVLKLICQDRLFI